jgi:hypothetical protein
MINSILNQQGNSIKSNAIFKTLEDFEISTSNKFRLKTKSCLNRQLLVFFNLYR